MKPIKTRVIVTNQVFWIIHFSVEGGLAIGYDEETYQLRREDISALKIVDIRYVGDERLR